MPLHQPVTAGATASRADGPARVPAPAAARSSAAAASPSLGHHLRDVAVSPPPPQVAATPARATAAIQLNGDKQRAARRLALLAGHLSAQPGSNPAPEEPLNRYAGAIVDREPGRGPAVQGPLTLDAHRLLISRNLNVRSSNLDTFERAARNLAREREGDEALLAESTSLLADPKSQLSRFHLQIRKALAAHGNQPIDEIPDDALMTVHRVRQLAGGQGRAVVAQRTDPTGTVTHPTTTGAFTEEDPGHGALAALGLSSQSGTSGSAADAVRGLAALLGPEALAGQEQNIIRLAHVYMRDPRFYSDISQKIQQVKGGRRLEEPAPEDVGALPGSHTHSLGEIAQGVHLQLGVSRGEIDPRNIPKMSYLKGAFASKLLLARALARSRKAKL